MKSRRLAKKAADLYVSGLSIEDVARELNVAYRTARKAILFSKTEIRKKPKLKRSTW